MLLFSSIPIFEQDGKNCVYKVNSKNTSYRVVVAADLVRVYGPGVEESYEVGSDGDGDIPASFGNEARAIAAVMLLEEGE
jgi:hypothetical protein